MNNNMVARFYKVSFEQFYEGYIDTYGYRSEPKEIISKIYENIKLPHRATKGSAGYDIYSPIDITLQPGNVIKIPTGIYSTIEDGWVLMIYPRSGLGFKYRLQLNNTVGIIDSDYSCSDNEGHIFLKMKNDGDKLLKINAGDAVSQGIFLPYGVTIDDDAKGVRNGGFGSTGR